MGIRETLNQNEKIVTIATVVIIGIALLFVAGQLMCDGRPGVTGGGAEIFFTTDGVEYFADDATKIYPFDKDGTKAFRAYVFEGNDGDPYIGYIEGYTPEAQEALRAARDPNAPPEMAMVGVEIEMTGKMIARPEDINDMSKWVPATSPESQNILREAANRVEGAKRVRP